MPITLSGNTIKMQLDLHTFRSQTFLWVIEILHQNLMKSVRTELYPSIVNNPDLGLEFSSRQLGVSGFKDWP